METAMAEFNLSVSSDVNMEAATKPECPICKMDTTTPAKASFHQEAHAPPFGDPLGLGYLPYVLFERVARLMEDYHAFRSNISTTSTPTDKID